MLEEPYFTTLLNRHGSNGLIAAANEGRLLELRDQLVAELVTKGMMEGEQYPHVIDLVPPTGFQFSNFHAKVIETILNELDHDLGAWTMGVATKQISEARFSETEKGTYRFDSPSIRTEVVRLTFEDEQVALVAKMLLEG